MGYVLETLAEKPVFWIKVFAPTDGDDAIRLLMSIYEKVRSLKENQSFHIVLDISPFTFSDDFPASQFIGVLGQAYDKWHSTYQLRMWIVVDTSLFPVIRSLVRNVKVSANVHTQYDEVIDAIEQMLGSTDDLNDDAWNFLKS